MLKAIDGHQLDFEDGSLRGRMPELVTELSALLARYRPDVLLVGTGLREERPVPPLDSAVRNVPEPVAR